MGAGSSPCRLVKSHATLLDVQVPMSPHCPQDNLLREFEPEQLCSQIELDPSLAGQGHEPSECEFYRSRVERVSHTASQQQAESGDIE
ncbi:hypothetical protein RRG08_044168 [Elysia crispata]|uniref:Uncharacterized protein n=1 Tax=Elysia crispata TaxID=231223 RepID=A0AAE1CNE2_9GAST|nr:hypothetical protein RRG08_044168 [Elysia crispata]